MTSPRGQSSARPKRAQRRQAVAQRRQAVLQEARRHEERRRRRGRLTWAALLVGGVAVVLGVIVFTGLRWTNASGAKTTSADATVVHTLESIPTATFDKVGAGQVDVRPSRLTGQPALTENGKPRVLYVGAEYCPFCAAQRWAVVTALSRFGTFAHLGQTTSAHGDIYPDTPTLSFHGSSYASQYLAFKGYELQSNQVQGQTYAPLDTMSKPDATIFAKYDAPPYLATNGSIPFLDLGGRYVSQGASYSPGLLSGMDHSQVAQAIADRSSDVSKAVLGTANTITAALCTLTNNQPGSVCTSSGVTAAANTLGQS